MSEATLAAQLPFLFVSLWPWVMLPTLGSALLGCSTPTPTSQPGGVV